jgi:hypothetical protein
MKNRYIGLLAVLLTTSVAASAQGKKYHSHADSVNALKNIIGNSNTISSSAVGFAGSPSNTWYAFAYLTSIATEKELLEMTKDKNPVLKLYAYTALMHKNYKHINRVKKQLAKDDTEVKTLSGCIMGNTTVAKAAEDPGTWYYAGAIDEFEKAIKKDKKYKKELYTSLINNKPVKRFPYEG